MIYAEHHYQSNDGLKLYYRTYGKDSDKLPIVCLTGLTRNSGDFEEFAERFSNTRKIYTLDYRGRGNSAYDPNYQNYNPQTYLADVMTFLAAADIKKAIFVGTSLGGLITMGLSGLAPQFVAGAILNDIGPEVASSGGERIAGYVGTDVRYNSLEEAAKAQQEQYQGAYPDIEEEYWLQTSKVAFKFDEDADNYRPNYDLAIGKALVEQVESGDQIDLWPFFESLKEKPVLAVRGALSDVLSTDVFEKMKAVIPSLIQVTLENRGHVPLLNEPKALTAITEFLDKN